MGRLTSARRHHDQLAPEQAPGGAGPGRRRDVDVADERGGGRGDEHADGEAPVEGAGAGGEHEGDRRAEGDGVEGDGAEHAERHRAVSLTWHEAAQARARRAPRMRAR